MTTTTIRIDNGFGRVVHGETTSGGHQLVIHLADAHDTSGPHRTYPTGYDSRCGWCWLGANHSENAHKERTS